jgi:membrane-bound serine protease (ClpP class)
VNPPRARRFAPSWLRLLALATLALAAALSLSLPVSAQQPRVYSVELTGVINELNADHATRALRRAERDGAAAFLIVLDSPGGVDRAVRRINHAILSSTVPVFVYVGPDENAQALSGAFLIMLAANVAGAHPEATIGSAPPPGLWERIGPEERAARIEFATQIATRTAEVRGRDVEHVTTTVREQVMMPAAEALDAGLIDATSGSASQLLAEFSGAQVQTMAGNVTLNTANARIVPISMTFWERVLDTITHPSIAYALLSVGLLLLVLELFNPGKLIAGLPGVVCLILAFVALGNLPVSWLGLGLIVTAALLFVAELRTPWIGIVGAIGLVAYLAGSFSLYRPVGAMSALAPDVSVNPWVIVATTTGWVAVLLLTMRALFRARQGQLREDFLNLTGKAGVVIEPLNPRGVVRIVEQEWSAVSDVGEVAPGTEVQVVRMQGGTLHVRPIGEIGTEQPAGLTARESEQIP